MNKIKFLIFTTFLFLNFFSPKTLCASSNPNDTLHERVSNMFLVGVKALTIENNHKKAAAFFAEAIRLDSTHAASHYYISGLLTNKQDAIKHGLKAIEYDSTNIWYKSQLTKILAYNNEYEKAAEIAEKTIQQAPNDIDNYITLFTLLMADKQYDKVSQKIKHYEHTFGENETISMFKLELMEYQEPSLEIVEQLKDICKLYPSNATAKAVLAETYMKLKMPNEAIVWFKKAESIEPNNIKVIVALSDYYLRTNNIDSMYNYTIKVFSDTRLNLDAKFAFVKEVLFSQYFYQNHFLKVDYLLRLLVETYPNSLEAHKTLAQHFINSRMLEKASQVYQQTISDSTADKDIYFSLIGLKNYQNQHDSVIYFCDKMIEVYPETVYDNSLQKSYSFMQQKQYEKSISLLQNLLLISQDRMQKSNVYALMGDIYNEWGKSKESYKSYDLALKLDKNNIVVKNNYAYHLSVQNKQLGKALKFILAVVEKEPTNGTYLDTYGWILYQMGQYDKAVEILQKAVDNDTTNSATLFLHLGDAYFKIGKTANAKVYWLKADKNGADKLEIKKRLNSPNPIID